jgi:hypothetical protein
MRRQLALDWMDWPNLERLTKCLWQRCVVLPYVMYSLRQRVLPETASLILFEALSLSTLLPATEYKLPLNSPME